jgi:hypothetical protein
MERQHEESIDENEAGRGSEQEMNEEDQKAHEAEIADIFGNDDDEVMMVSGKRWNTNEENDMKKMKKINDDEQFWRDISQIAYNSMKTQERDSMMISQGKN